MDFQLEQWVNAGAGANGAVDALMLALAQWSEVAFIALVGAWFVYGVVRGVSPDRAGAVAALLASGVALAANQLISMARFRPRPFIAHPGRVHLLVPHIADASFPSDHVAAAAAISVVLLAVHRRWGMVSLFVTVLVGYARVFAGVHYPGDVAGGAVVGLAAGVLLTAAPATRALGFADRRLRERRRPG